MAKKTRDALEILERLTGDDPELREMIAEETVNAQVARMIYDARTAAGLTQEHFLLASLEPGEDGVAAAWDQEISRRVEEIRSGCASGAPAEEVFAELRREDL